ncbi:MAG: hypothetical protein LBJ00_12305 [Planctomycetaceae bacterium]|nr:hypothetical protein [Planctomycetaceae bacterium]
MRFIKIRVILPRLLVGVVSVPQRFFLQSCSGCFEVPKVAVNPTDHTGFGVICV